MFLFFHQVAPAGRNELMMLNGSLYPGSVAMVTSRLAADSAAAVAGAAGGGRESARPQQQQQYRETAEAASDLAATRSEPMGGLSC